MAPRRSKTSPPPLHELEAEVMAEMWAQEEATVRDILEALNKGKKQRAYTTIMTILSRLHDKGLLVRKRLGKADVYSPVMTREDYLEARAQAEVLALVDEFGDVALAKFAEQVDRLDSARLQRLRQLARDE